MVAGERSKPGQHERLEPLYDIDPRTGTSIEVFFADRTMETFGRCVRVGFGGHAGEVMRQQGPPLDPSLRATQPIDTR
jgi:hypothetical protein